MALQTTSRGIGYASSRRGGAAHFSATYGPTGDIYHSLPGSIDYWFTERYCLYTVDPQAGFPRGDIHHLPWPLQPAFANIESNTMTAPLGIALPPTAPLLHFARRVDAIAWRPERIGIAKTRKKTGQDLSFRGPCPLLLACPKKTWGQASRAVSASLQFSTTVAGFVTLVRAAGHRGVHPARSGSTEASGSRRREHSTAPDRRRNRARHRNRSMPGRRCTNTQARSNTVRN